jgi:5-(carboxyamino)imidazole ribonucleotide synthase
MPTLPEEKKPALKDKSFYGLKLGILGGGQLGRMLIQAASDYNVHCFVLDPDSSAPCKGISKEFVNGNLLDFDTVYNFGKTVDLLTIEIEHVNVDALEKLQKEGLTIFPQPEIIRMVQDKGLQKEFYKKNNIPTSDFTLINMKSEIKTFPIVQKLRKLGYDGKGVLKLNSELDLEKAFNEPCILEKAVDIEKEISIIVSRNLSGEVKLFPAIELVFKEEANLVDYLFSPASISETIKVKANEIALNLAKALNIVGILAVEMFISKKGEILVNEIAPRPHNSGHHTIEGNFTSQFEQHLRAVLNLPLGETGMIMPAAMVNLLGEKGYEGEAKFIGIEEILKIPGVYIHLYGKKYTRSNRKMGHVTILDEDINSAFKKVKLIKEKVKVIS